MKRHPYSFNVFWNEEDGGFIATCPEFPGLSAFGRSPEEAVQEAETVLEMYVEEYEKDGVPLPEPHTLDTHSGKLSLRMPKSLHATLARMADAEGVSLNTLIVTALSRLRPGL